MPPTPTIVKLAFATGQLVFALIYGTLGTVLTFLQFLRLGPRKFFTRVSRPTPPAVAIDPVYGAHELIKLKVFIIVFLLYKYVYIYIYISHPVLLFIMCQKVHQINH